MSRSLMAVEGREDWGGLERSSLSSPENIIITTEKPSITLAMMGKQIHFLTDMRTTYSILPTFAGKPTCQPTTATEEEGHVNAVHVPKQIVTRGRGRQEMVVRPRGGGQ